MKTKKALYQENGVREYWVIDPNHKSAHQFALNPNNDFEILNIYASDDILKCHIFEGLNIDLEKLFAH